MSNLTWCEDRRIVNRNCFYFSESLCIYSTEIFFWEMLQNLHESLRFLACIYLICQPLTEYKVRSIKHCIEFTTFLLEWLPNQGPANYSVCSSFFPYRQYLCSYIAKDRTWHKDKICFFALFNGIWTFVAFSMPYPFLQKHNSGTI